MQKFFNNIIFRFYQIIILIFILDLVIIVAIPNFKSIRTSDYCYYIITNETINYYYENNTNILSYIFDDNQKIISEEESEMISFSIFKDNKDIANLLIVKNYVYAVHNGNKLCHSRLNEITGFPSKVFAFKCLDSNCYYIIGFINHNKELILYLYENPSTYCNSIAISHIIINNITSINFSCELMNFSNYSINEEALTCFYQNNNTNEIIATVLNINITNKKIDINFSTKTKIDDDNIIIKSVLSQNSSISYVCYINGQNSSNCLIYNIIKNKWEFINNTYLNNCLPDESSFIIEYFDKSNEFYLYCFQSSIKFNLIKLNENFIIKRNDIYDAEEKLNQCFEYYLSSLIQDSNIVKIFGKCNNEIKIYEFEEIKKIASSNIILESSLPFTTIFTLNDLITQNILYSNIILESSFPLYTVLTLNDLILPSNLPNIIPSINHNEINIIQKKSNKTKEEMISNMNEIMKECEIDNVYEIYGNDYNIKISPINTKEYKNISTYVDLLSCEDDLRKYYKISKNKILTIFQIEISKKNPNSLINQVEYAIFDDQANQLNLSVCSEDSIKICYSIVNSSLLNISTISHFNENGVDIFNIKDNFFNDICYPYSEGSSDLIIKDRIKDIYQNYSLCDSNCEYEKINIQNMTITCNCRVKSKVETKIEEPTFDIIVFNVFKFSTFEIIK